VFADRGADGRNFRVTGSGRFWFALTAHFRPRHLGHAGDQHHV
jgi:hypothetical protein